VAFRLTLGAIVLCVQVVAAGAGRETRPHADFFVFEQVGV
jgi:hypothetical protein